MAGSCSGVSISGVYQNNGIQISLQTPMGKGSTFIPLPFCTKEECAANKGKAGPPGKAGRDGRNGKDGRNGRNGKDGKNGRDGKNGKDGKDGKDGYTPIKGKDYFDGAPGRDGRNGKDGRNGYNGRDGKDGARGKDGQNGFGVAGRNGRDGKDGRNGKDGKNGKNGRDGVAGPRGVRGLPGPAGPQGLKGDPGTSAAISSCAITLTWNPETDTLSTTLQVNECNSSASVAIPVDLSQVINLLTDIQGKVTVDAAIKKGTCNPPAEAGEWYEYAADSPSTVDSFSDAFARLSDQIEAIHKDTCKAVRGKISLPDVPRPPVCQESTDAEGNVTYAIVDADDTQLAGFGWVLPWVLGSAAEKTIDYVTEKSLDWLFNFIRQQETRALEQSCKALEEEDLPVIGCLPKIKEDTSKIPVGTDKFGNFIYPKKFIKWNLGGSLIDVPDYASEFETETRPLYKYELLYLRAIHHPIVEGLHPEFLPSIDEIVNRPSLQSYLIAKDLCRADQLVPNVPTIVCYDPANPEHATWTDPEKEAGYKVVTTDPIPQPVAIQVLANEIGKLNIKACQEESNDACQVLLPDPRAIWNTHGYYIFFYWKIQGATTPQEKKWCNVTQLAEPIEELLNPEDPSTVWGDYFAPIYQVIGNQWGQVMAANKARRYPLYRGWFLDKDEARRFFTSIEGLTQIPYRAENNPSYPERDNPNINHVNTGKTAVLRKVCVGLKHEDTDQVDILQSYAPSP